MPVCIPSQNDLERLMGVIKHWCVTEWDCQALCQHPHVVEIMMSLIMGDTNERIRASPV